MCLYQIQAVLAEAPEAERKQYEMTMYQKIQLRDQKKTPAELALQAGRAYVVLPKKYVLMLVTCCSWVQQSRDHV